MLTVARHTGAALLLLGPAWLAVMVANHTAGVVDPLVQAMIAPMVEVARSGPEWLAVTLAGRFGLLTMGPLLLVWAVPVAVLHALLVGVYRTSGVLERLTNAVQPLVRPFGLTGHDLVRVVMGFGCNVPAVVATRSCTQCSRPVTMAVIAFGAACSYQMGATLAVFSAANRPWLVVPFLAALGLSTLLFARLVSTPHGRAHLPHAGERAHTRLRLPTPGPVWRDASGTILSFFQQAFPVFVVIAVAASISDWLGVFTHLAWAITPAMAVFNLRPEAAIAVVFASVRKDGILLLAEPGIVATLTAVQLLTAVYLAGVLVPCLVTAATIARERTWRFAGVLVTRQVVFACGCAAAIAWIGAAL